MTMLPSSAFNDIAHRPSGLLVYVGNSADPCASTQVHHLIPREVWLASKFLNEGHAGQILSAIGGLNDPMNLMELPSTAAGAEASNLALHNGSHPLAYTNAAAGRLEEVTIAYSAALAANGGVPSPQTDMLLTTSIHALELDLRLRLDRSSGVFPQLALSNSDPNAFMVSPAYRAEMATLGSIVDGVQANPRDAYPSNSSAQQACEAVRQLTAEQLRATATELRDKAWAGVPEGSRPDDVGAGVLAKEQTEQQLPQMKERTITDIMAQTAREHPFDAAMASIGVGMIAAVGGVALVGAEATVAAGTAVASTASRFIGARAAAATASSVGAVVLDSDPAQASPATIGQPLSAVLPGSHAEMTQGADQMGERGEVKRIAIERMGGPAQGHLIVQQDGSVKPGTIPFDHNPQIAAGKNSETLGVLYAGTGAMNDAQYNTVTNIQQWLEHARQREGLSPQVDVIAGSTATAEILHLPTPRGPLASSSMQTLQGPSINRQRATAAMSGP